MNTGTGVVGVCFKKPVMMEAMFWNGGEVEARAILDWIHASGEEAYWAEHGWHDHKSASCGKIYWEEQFEHIGIVWELGIKQVPPMHYIVKNEKGHFYQCSPENFTSTYDVQ